MKCSGLDFIDFHPIVKPREIPKDSHEINSISLESVLLPRQLEAAVAVNVNKKCSFIRISIKETLYCSISVKLIKTKEIVITPLLLSIIFSLSIGNSINNQHILAQPQLSSEEIENEHSQRKP